MISSLSSTLPLKVSVPPSTSIRGLKEKIVATRSELKMDQFRIVVAEKAVEDETKTLDTLKVSLSLSALFFLFLVFVSIIIFCFFFFNCCFRARSQVSQEDIVHVLAYDAFGNEAGNDFDLVEHTQDISSYTSQRHMRHMRHRHF